MSYQLYQQINNIISSNENAYDQHEFALQLHMSKLYPLAFKHCANEQGEEWDPNFPPATQHVADLSSHLLDDPDLFLQQFSTAFLALSNGEMIA